MKWIELNLSLPPRLACKPKLQPRTGRKALNSWLAVIQSMSGAENRVYNVAGNEDVGETLEKELSGPEASGFL